MALGVLLGAAAAPTASAAAAEVTRVASGFEPGKWLDLDLSLSWVREEKRALVKRELAVASLPNGQPGTRLIDDLVYRQTRDLLRARLEVGVWRDLGLHVELPFVLRDDRRLDFDQSEGDACVYPPAATPTCVNADNATILRDGILPPAHLEGGQMVHGVDAAHVDAANPRGRGFGATSAGVFRGPTRRGIEALGLGLAWAAMNQRRDPSKPTWLLALDARFDVGSSMRYDAARPGANTGVGLGYHQLIAATVISKRFTFFDPYVGFYYIHPLVPDGSLYARPAVGSQPYAGPQKRAGVQFGFENILWERPEASQRMTLELRGRAEHRFQGQSASELWEPLSGGSDCAANISNCRSGLDVREEIDSQGNLVRRPAPHPGITETQAYSTAAADLGLNVQVGRYARFRGVFGLATELPHFITFATAGQDRTGDGQVNSNDRDEANPSYREAVDLPGRRFKVEATQIWTLLLEGSILF